MSELKVTDTQWLKGFRASTKLSNKEIAKLEAQLAEADEKIVCLTTDMPLNERLLTQRKSIGRLQEQLDAVRDLEYRHECLKSLYSDEMNLLDDDQSVDDAIDIFIQEVASHS